MIIIGILAAIAIPVFLSQRAKAHDASTKADVNTLGQEIATFFVDGTGATSISLTPRRATPRSPMVSRPRRADHEWLGRTDDRGLRNLNDP